MLRSSIRTNELALCADTTMTERHRRFYWPLLLIAGLTVGIIPAAAKRGSNSSIDDDKKTVAALDTEYQAAVKISVNIDASFMENTSELGNKAAKKTSEIQSPPIRDVKIHNRFAGRVARRSFTTALSQNRT
jgi:hypothetical protein